MGDMREELEGKHYVEDAVNLLDNAKDRSRKAAKSAKEEGSE